MNFANTDLGFQGKIYAIAAAAGMTGEAVYELWRNYSRQCDLYDQSPVLPEFIEWYAAEMGGDRAALSKALQTAEEMVAAMEDAEAQADAREMAQLRWAENGGYRAGLARPAY